MIEIIGTSDAVTGGTLGKPLLFFIFIFSFNSKKKSKAWIGPSKRAWRCRMDPTRKESGTFWGTFVRGAREVR